MSSPILLFLTSLAPIPAAIILVILPTAAIMLLTWMIRRWVGYDKLVINNQLAGIKYGVVGLAYVMILTFATITVWDKFSLAQTSVIEETSAARAIGALLNSSNKEERIVLVSLERAPIDLIRFRIPESAEV